MPRLSVLAVKNAKPGRLSDGDGLCLLVKPSGARSWLLRIQQDGKRRDIGLGSVALQPPAADDPSLLINILHRRILTLAEAREKAALLRRLAKGGLDPKEERDRDRQTAPTFGAAARAAHEALSGGWSTKNAAAFLSSLEAHAFPVLGSKRVSNIETSDVQAVLAPIWLSKPEMARKIRHRVGTVLNFAQSKGWRSSEAPKASVRVGLPTQAIGGNFKAMPFADVPTFYAAQLAGASTIGRNALALQILTAARPGEVRLARWEHFDLDAGLWHRPAELMKGRRAKAHTVTLNAAAVSLLGERRKLLEPKGTDFVFPGRGEKPLSDMTFGKVLRDAKLPFNAHGFRSSFRDWAAETMPEIPDAVAEAALAHVVPDKVVAAYKRTTFLEMRRGLLDAWGRFVTARLI